MAQWGTYSKPHVTRAEHPALLALLSARGGTRTLTPLREPDFESGASTNSTTRATVQHFRILHAVEPTLTFCPCNPLKYTNLN